MLLSSCCFGQVTGEGGATDAPAEKNIVQKNPLIFFVLALLCGALRFYFFGSSPKKVDEGTSKPSSSPVAVERPAPKRSKTRKAD